MKKLLLFWFIIFLSFSTQAQSILKMDKISHVVLHQGNISVIQHKNGLYQYINVNLKGFDEITTQEWRTWNDMQKYISEQSTVIPLDEISVFNNSKKFSNFIMNSQFEYKTNLETISFSPVSTYFFAVETQESYNEKLLNSELYRILELNRKHNLIVLNSGYILFDRNHKIKMFNYHDLTENVAIKPFDKNSSKEFLNKILPNNPIDYNRIFNKAGKDSIIYNYSFGERVDIKKFDTVHILKPFIIAEKGNKTSVYNYEGKILFSKIFRNWQVNQNTGQLITLEKNKIIYYDFDGSQAQERKPEPIGLCAVLDGKSYSIDSTDNHFIICKDDEFQQRVHLKNLPKNSTVSFVNGELWPSTTSYDITYPINNFDLIVSENGKSGLFKAIEGKYSFEFNDESEVETVELLPIVYDKIELFNGKLLLYQDGLIAVYPYFKTPNYLSIGEYQSGYYRITSKNNQKGWLEWFSGTEFWDN